ncbi:MAG: hypothetical protein HWN68_10705 [Desulfobacterales bacterium]|nr:hypothetical protein [Desulfobacterales bacterium]
MKMLEIMGTVGCVIFLLCLSLISDSGDSHAAEDQYPIRVEIIDKGQASYDTPEQTYTSMISSLVKKDLEWYYETSTIEFSKCEQEQFQQANIDPTKMFEMVNGLKEIFIINKVNYKDGVLLIVKTYKQDGTILVGPSALVQEQGKWKFTNKFAADEELHEYLDYFPTLFDGKGQRPADVNTFLSYANPLQMRTELPSGTTKFSLHIFYGQTIDPATFKAELNRQDISSQFEPKPVGDQVVELNLRKGQNVLLVSIKGKRKDDRTAKDRDRLVFIVP